MEMGALLIQPEIIDKSEKYTQKEIEVGVCMFDKTIRRSGLAPIFFIYQIFKGHKKAYHS